MGLVDCHIHTLFSHDSKCSFEDILNIAKKKQLNGVAVTDHCDIGSYENTDVKTPIIKSVNCAEKLGDYAFLGVEFGEALWHNDIANDILKSADFDIVLGSVHAVRNKNDGNYYSQIDFSAFTYSEICDYLSSYFYDVKQMIEVCDFDVLTHLTCPLRYINGKFGKSVDLKLFSEDINCILKLIIEKGIALEVNTSCCDTAYNSLLPDITILRQYERMGGVLLTLGSDAHTADRVAYAFDNTVIALKNIGFSNLYYYKKRKSVKYKI